MHTCGKRIFETHSDMSHRAGNDKWISMMPMLQKISSQYSLYDNPIVFAILYKIRTVHNFYYTNDVERLKIRTSRNIGWSLTSRAYFQKMYAIVWTQKLLLHNCEIKLLIPEIYWQIFLLSHIRQLSSEGINRLSMLSNTRLEPDQSHFRRIIDLSGISFWRNYGLLITTL